MYLAKVLVTAIGAGRLVEGRPSREYQKATYTIDDSEYTTEFIAEALIKHYQIERVFMVGTAKSMWEQVYYTFSDDRDRDDNYYLELAQAIDESNHESYKYDQTKLQKVEQALDRHLGSTGSRCFLIKYGRNNEELLYNFEILLQIANLLESGDEVYVDITHSFRSLSIFQYMMLSFIENLPGKEIKIKGILYGMLDIRKEMGGKAPVVNLSVINEINHWIKGMYDLESYGNGYLVARLLEERYPELARSIRDLSDRININYLKDIRSHRRQTFWRDLGHLDGPARIATKSLNRFLTMFSGDQQESFFELKVARWYFEKKRYATGYITLTEAIVTRACEVLGYDWHIYEEREQAKSRIREVSPDLEQLFRKVNGVRRDVAHFQGGNNDQYRSAVDKCFSYCQRAERLFRETGTTYSLGPI